MPSVKDRLQGELMFMKSQKITYNKNTINACSHGKPATGVHSYQLIQPWDKIHKKPSSSSSAAHSSTSSIDYLITLNIFATYSIPRFVFVWLSISSIRPFFLQNLLISSCMYAGKKNFNNGSMFFLEEAKDYLNFLGARLKQCSSNMPSNAVVLNPDGIL